MAEKKIRVLIVDDSAVIRKMLADLIEAEPGMQVVGTAVDGMQALVKVDELSPDVITLDLQMPGMDGLKTLDHLLKKHPIPVLMVSSLTKRGTRITFDALERGAVDYLPKPDYGADFKYDIKEELIRKIQTVAGLDVRKILEIREGNRVRRREKASVKPTEKEFDDASAKEFNDKCIALGISTGGPPALSHLFSGLKTPIPPLVIVQHMPPNFTKPLAWRLDSLSPIAVKEAEAGDILRPNRAYIAPGGKHIALKRSGGLTRIFIEDGPPVSSHKPSIDVMMKSAAAAYGKDCLGVIMTGMGRDGSDGCKAIRQQGGFVLGQDEKSSEVYGMNKVAFVEGNVDRQFALHDCATIIMLQMRRLWSRETIPV